MTAPTLGRVGWGGIVGLAIAGVLASYGHTLWYDFAYDDYFLARPWTWTQLERVWHSTWDPTRVSVVFYRPLTAWWYALRFDLFGLNGFPQHALSLAGMIVCSAMAGLFVWREIGSRRAASLASLLYAIYPAMAYAQAVWLTNQMHLMSSGLVLLALLAWQSARRRGPLAWMTVFLLQVLAFGTKEDTIMLVPLVLVLTLLRRVVVGDIRLPHWSVLAICAAFPVGLYTFRMDVLGRVGGYGGSLTIESAWANFTRATGLFTQQPADRPWQTVASIAATGALALGGVSSLLRRPALYLLMVGLTTAAAFNIPFILVTKVEQYHLVAFGAVVTLTGAIEALVTLASRAAIRHTVTALVVIPLLSFVPVTRHIARDFAPCSSITLATDQLASGWSIVPPEVNAWLHTKPAACATGDVPDPLRDLPTVTWAFPPQPGDDGQTFQWTSAEASLLVRRDASSLVLGVRQPLAAPDAPITVTIRGPGQPISEVLTSAEWREVEVPLTRTPWTSLRGMHRVDVHVSPTFVPDRLDRNANDNRRLGVQLRILGVQ